MNLKIAPSHVAVLVPSVSKAADYLAQFNFQIGNAEEWDGEGTKEIYVERDKSNSLLLMEPIKPGVYQRALEKRGPGFHHLAIDVLNLEEYIESLAGSGWLLHPRSIKTIQQTQTAYLARPGFPALIEVQEKKEFSTSKSLFVNQISLKMDSKHEGLLKSVGLDSIIKASNEAPTLFLNNQVINLKDLL